MSNANRAKKDKMTIHLLDKNKEVIHSLKKVLNKEKRRK
jgi:hypothetical protein